jgi:exopolysaccharide biosynthesis polyprenyl glycosylphosphotransferase
MPISEPSFDQNPFREDQTSTNRSLADSPGIFTRTLETLVKRRDFVLLFMDIALIALSFVGAYHLRFQMDILVSRFGLISYAVPDFEPYGDALILTSMVWIFLLWKDQSYSCDLLFLRSFANQIRQIVVSGFYAMIFLMVTSFMFRYMLLSRVVYFTVFASSCVLLSLTRAVFYFANKHLEKCLILRRILVLGHDHNLESLMKRFETQHSCVHVIGQLRWCAEHSLPSNPKLPILGYPENLDAIYEAVPFDHMIIAGYGYNLENDQTRREALIQTLNFCEAKAIDLYFLPDFVNVAVKQAEIGSLGGLPIFSLRDASLHPCYAIVKRFMDLTIATTICVLGLPVWLVLALMIKLADGGPIFFVQTRSGRHGKPFEMYKFRSMVQDAETRLREILDFDKLDEPVFKIPNDPRVTAVGRFLRRTSLDEIPQLINVIQGSMSLVGPRPEQIELVEKYTPYQRRRLKATPGITGYQQIVSRADPSLNKRIELDLYYLKRQSLFLDLYILFSTILVIVRGSGAK